jgi:DNA-directed RNA polymerase specialized sigma subunit
VVKTLKPTINYALASYNAADDPFLRSQAEVYTAKAIKKYDPSFGANLSTHVSNQLKQLSRAARMSKSPVSMPDRAQLDAYQLHVARKSYEDEHGREPDAVELADYSGLPLKRIEKIGQMQISTPSESGFGGDLEQGKADLTPDALEYVHHDSDHIDRRIMELKTGYGGHKPLSPQEVCAKLRLTPSQLSRRSQRLAYRIQKIQASLENIT